MNDLPALAGHCTDEAVKSSVEGIYLHVDELLRFIPRMTPEQLAVVWESCPFPGDDLEDVLADLGTWYKIALATLGGEEPDEVVGLAG